MIHKSPDSIDKTLVYEKIVGVKEDKYGLLEKVTTFLSIATPILDTIIVGPFKNYTLHNREHAKKIVHLVEYICSKDTLDKINPFECLLIIYSAYLHDMGMAYSHDEIIAKIQSESYQESIRKWRQLFNAIDQLRKSIMTASEEEKSKLELELGDLHCAGLANYLRPLHAEKTRYKEIINSFKSQPNAQNLFNIAGVSFEDELVEICTSHNLNSVCLGELKNAHVDRFPRRLVVSDNVANTQFVAALLRLADILDFDFERTPFILFESLGIKTSNIPGAEVSLLEWQKHLSVQQLEIRDEELVIKAQCYHPVIEATIHKFATLIEEEIRQTISIIKRNTVDIQDKYRLIIPTNVRTEIKSIGYKYMELSLRLDEISIMNLLMGTNLYQTPFTGIREIIQNSIDACVVGTKINRNYTNPSIVVTSKEIGTQKWIIISDNGIGMNEHILKQYFFCIGKSYYSSTDFERILNMHEVREIPVISRFGIGFIAAFMIADLIEVETRAMPSIYEDQPGPGYRISVEKLGTLAYVQEIDSIPIGTTIRLRLKGELINLEDVNVRILEYINDNLLRPEIPIDIHLGKIRIRKSKSEYYKIKQNEIEFEKYPDYKVRVVPIDVNQYIDYIEGIIILFFVEDKRTNKLGYKIGDEELLFGEFSQKYKLRIPARKIIDNYGGNRITLGGMRILFPHFNRILRRGYRRITIAYDLNFVPNEKLNFDVSRTRLIDGKMVVRNEILQAIKKHLVSIGIWEKLETEVQKIIKEKEQINPFTKRIDALKKFATIVSDDDLLEKVFRNIPADHWPSDLHQQVAKQLNITNQLAFNAITTLIIAGRITNPNRL